MIFPYWDFCFQLIGSLSEPLTSVELVMNNQGSLESFGCSDIRMNPLDINQIPPPTFYREGFHFKRFLRACCIRSVSCVIGNKITITKCKAALKYV